MTGRAQTDECLPSWGGRGPRHRTRTGHMRLRPNGGQAPHFTRRAAVFQGPLNSRDAIARLFRLIRI